MSLGRLIPRKRVSEQFSQFLDVEENRSPDAAIPWKRMLPLENNMRHHMKSCSATERSYCLKYWWQEACSSNSTYAKYHLAAGLEESCYWVAKKSQKRYFPQDESIQLEYFQITRRAALTPQTFSTYNDSRGTLLETYLEYLLEQFLRRVIFQGKEAAAGYSSWGLLLHTSNKFTRKALIQAGIEEQQQYRCMLARRCFREIYAPQTEKGRLQEPTSEEWAKFAERYNQLRSSQEPAVNNEGIKAWLNICINSGRASTEEPRFISRDDPNYSEEDLEHINNEHLRSPTSDISQEQAQQEERLQQINVVLANATEALPKLGQTMLQLFYGLGLTQRNIGEATSLQQYEVSRELKKYKYSLLKALAEWSRTQMGIDLDDEKINRLQGPLKEWLDRYCSSFFHAYLQKVLINELRDEIPLLRRHYGQGLSPMKVSRELNLSETAVNQRLEQTKQHLQTRLYNWVKDTYNLCLNALDSIGKLIADLVEEWLIKLKYELGNLGESR